jgi:hypothetical protein
VIDHISVTSLSAAAIVDAAVSHSGAAEDEQAFDELPAARPVPIVASGRTGRAQQKMNPLANLLQAQANTIQQGVANIEPTGGSNPPLSAVSPRSTPQSSSPSMGGTQASLAAMTQTARANVQMLVKALNAVCIGASCAQ